MSDYSADVLIVGGGLVGGPLAVALADAGLTVVVADAEDPATAVAPAFDGRASALGLAQQRVLAAIGLWPAVEPLAAEIREVRVADGVSPLFLHYDHRLLGDQPLGWIVENRALRQAVLARMRSHPLIRLAAPSRPRRLERGAGAVQAILSTGETVSAALAVAADGRASPTRAGAGIGITGWTYRQSAIVCTVGHERPHGNVAQEHFLPSGPFAILPLPGRRSSVVWTERQEVVPAIMAEDDEAFLAELGDRFGGFLGAITLEGPRFAYPLALQFAHAYRGHRLVLVGDAAHGMHPVAGQGMNMGLRDVAALAEVLVEAKRLGLDLGAADVLERYARWRRFDNILMLAVTDGLVRLFSNDLPPLRLARDLGLAAVNRLDPVKRFFMRHAMGLVGDLPRLMRGESL